MEVAGFGVHVMLLVLSRNTQVLDHHFNVYYFSNCRVAAGGVKSGFGEQQTRSFKAKADSIYKSSLDTILWRATAGQSEFHSSFTSHSVLA